MKNILTTCIVAVLVVSGCTKQSSDPTPVMNATINSQPFSALGPGITATTKGSMTTITGQNAVNPGSTTNTTIALTMPVDTGTFVIGGIANAILISSSTGVTGAFASSGTIVVTNKTASILQGTFNFTCEDANRNAVVTTGQFTAKY